MQREKRKPPQARVIAFGKLLRSEANDLKRPLPLLAKEVPEDCWRNPLALVVFRVVLLTV